jgi:hypothetical protein
VEVSIGSQDSAVTDNNETNSLLVAISESENHRFHSAPDDQFRIVTTTCLEWIEATMRFLRLASQAIELLASQAIEFCDGQAPLENLAICAVQRLVCTVPKRRRVNIELENLRDFSLRDYND